MMIIGFARDTLFPTMKREMLTSRLDSFLDWFNSVRRVGSIFLYRAAAGPFGSQHWCPRFH
jgi:hypothetical protein